jgi:hypothetical protein
MFSFSSLMSMPDEEFDDLGEDELALLTRRFKRLHENRVNMRRNTRTFFQCGKPGHFVADCPDKAENKDSYKHKPSKDGKYRSRRDHKNKYKTSDDRGRRRAEARPERWLERVTSTPVPRTPPRARAAAKTKAIAARTRSRPGT